MFNKLKNNYFILIVTFFIIYFFLNLIYGERGLFSYFKKKEHYNQLQKDQNHLKVKIAELDLKNSLLTDDIDLDFIEILIREKFLFGKKSETTYILKENGNKK